MVMVNVEKEKETNGGNLTVNYKLAIKKGKKASPVRRNSFFPFLSFFLSFFFLIIIVVTNKFIYVNYWP